MKRMWIAFAVILAAALPARVYAAMELVDPSTGYYMGSGVFVQNVSLAIAAAILLLLILAATLPKSSGNAPVRSLASAVFCAVSAASVAVQSAVGFLQQDVGRSAIMERIAYVAGFFACAVLLVFAYALAFGKPFFEKHPLMALIPSCWGCLWLISLFIRYTGDANQLENVYHTFTEVFLLLFLFSQAKLAAGIERQKSIRKIYAFGFPAVLMVFCDALPNCVRLYSGLNSLGDFPVMLYFINLAFAFYILFFMAALHRACLQADEEEEVPEAPADLPADAQQPLRREMESAQKENPVSVRPAAAPEPLHPEVFEAKNEGITVSDEERKALSGIFEPQDLNEISHESASEESLTQQCAEFLKNAYQSGVKFVKIGENDGA